MRETASSAIGADERACNEAVGRKPAAEALRVEGPGGWSGGGGGPEEGRERVAVGARAGGEHGREEAEGAA